MLLSLPWPASSPGREGSPSRRPRLAAARQGKISPGRWSEPLDVRRGDFLDHLAGTSHRAALRGSRLRSALAVDRGDCFPRTLVGRARRGSRGECRSSPLLQVVNSGDTVLGSKAPDVLILPPSVAEELSETDESLGTLGRPFDRRTPFFVGLTGALGVAVAYLVVRGIVDVSSVLVIIGMALFIAIGLSPILEFLISRGLTRLHRGRHCDVRVPGCHRGIPGRRRTAHLSRGERPRDELPAIQSGPACGKGLGRQAGRQVPPDGLPEGQIEVAAASHRRGVGTRQTRPFVCGRDDQRRRSHDLLSDRASWREELVAFVDTSQPARAGPPLDRRGLRPRRRLHAGQSAHVACFRNRHLRVACRVFGVPYSLLLALFVAMFDLIPLVGSTIAGIVVSLVALTGASRSRSPPPCSTSSTGSSRTTSSTPA